MANENETQTPVEEQKQAHSYALDSKCPSCGGPLKYNATIQKFKCEYCDSEFDVKELDAKSNNAAKAENNKKDNDYVEDDDTVYVTYTCPDCGAEIVADEQTVATFCLYCGNTSILKNKLTGKFHPDLIIPFKVDKAQAEEAFKNIHKGRMFVPKDFNAPENIEKIRGCYVPFWFYTTDVTSHIDGTGKNIKTWTTGRTHYTKTDTYKFSRDAVIALNKIPKDASSRFDDNLMNSIEPYDYTKLEPYNHAYLSGFYAEKYDEDSEVSYPKIQKDIDGLCEEKLRSTTTYSTVSVVGRKFEHQIKEKQYALLPVWMVNVKYKGKMHLFAMNGETGKFIGNIPLDKKKVLITTIITFLVSIVGCFLLNLIFFLISKI
jgi:DNA-directed RNA polymerase subunit RPC12/RpoP